MQHSQNKQTNKKERKKKNPCLPLMDFTLRAGGEGGERGYDGWMASPTQWTWVWANSKTVKDKEGWRAATHGVAKTRLSDWTSGLQPAELGYWQKALKKVTVLGPHLLPGLAAQGATPWVLPALSSSVVTKTWRPLPVVSLHLPDTTSLTDHRRPCTDQILW